MHPWVRTVKLPYKVEQLGQIARVDGRGAFSASTTPTRDFLNSPPYTTSAGRCGAGARSRDCGSACTVDELRALMAAGADNALAAEDVALAVTRAGCWLRSGAWLATMAHSQSIASMVR
jgi:hypothetical protein